MNWRLGPPFLDMAGTKSTAYNGVAKRVGDHRMPVFISHSFENKAEFDNIADALEQKGIEYWKPGTLKAGSLLSEQLRQSIVEAELCVFVATRHSLGSSWCGAELGAFWGADKPVVIYVAEASLSEDEMPKQFKGHLFERRIARVVEAVQAHLAKLRKTEEIADQLPRVASMTVEEMKLLIAKVVRQTQDAAFVETALRRLAFVFRTEDGPAQGELKELVAGLLGVLDTAVREGVLRSRDWTNSFSFSTNTGVWTGSARHWESPNPTLVPYAYYSDCIVWRVGADRRVEAIVVVKSIAVELQGDDIIEFSTPILTVGRGTLGDRVIRSQS
jgi:hypothetical protein